MWFALCVTILVVGEGRSLAQSTRRSESSGLLRHPRRTTARICCMCKSLLFSFINSAAALIDFLLLRVCLKEELELLSVLWTYPAVGDCTDTRPLTWSFQQISTTAWGLQQPHPDSLHRFIYYCKKKISIAENCSYTTAYKCTALK